MLLRCWPLHRSEVQRFQVYHQLGLEEAGPPAPCVAAEDGSAPAENGNDDVTEN